MLSFALDYIYPPSCHLCGTLTHKGHYLCPSCFGNAQRIQEPFCKLCSEPFDGAIDQPITCPNCHHLHFAFDFARAALKNTTSNHQLIIDFKYHNQFYLAKDLAKICSQTIQEDPRFSQLNTPALIPIPLHWYRQIRRGFNQAEELARSIHKRTLIPLLHNLRRVKPTQTQTKLDRKKRLHNLDNAFTSKPLPAKYQSVILIDDVFTTGSTANACASAIRKQSPHLENIVVLTALRG